jgi:phage terminase small subunit
VNPNQTRFAEYLIDLNATQAALHAGYSEKTAESIGIPLLRKTLVGAADSAGEQAGRQARIVTHGFSPSPQRPPR